MTRADLFVRKCPQCNRTVRKRHGCPRPECLRKRAERGQVTRRQGMQSGTVVLKNGAEEAEVFVLAGMGALRSLLAAEPVAFYELVQLCRNPAHTLWRPSVEVLKDRNLLEADGTIIHSSLRNLVRAAVDGDELEMRIVSPYAEVEA